MANEPDDLVWAEDLVDQFLKEHPEHAESKNILILHARRIGWLRKKPKPDRPADEPKETS